MLLFQQAVEALFPRFCVGCGCEGALLCLMCQVQWNKVPIHVDGKRHLFSFAYADAIARSLLCAWKYQYDRSAWEVLQKKMTEGRLVLKSFVQAAQIDVITPVSLHPMKRCLRGFDQAQVIAQELARQTNVSYQSLLQRKRFTRAQAKKGTGERRKFLRSQPFVLAQKDLREKHILLVDDVWTTGSTMRAAARVLRGAGAQVFYYTLAKGG